MPRLAPWVMLLFPFIVWKSCFVKLGYHLRRAKENGAVRTNSLKIYNTYRMLILLQHRFRLLTKRKPMKNTITTTTTTTIITTTTTTTTTTTVTEVKLQNPAFLEMRLSSLWPAERLLHKFKSLSTEGCMATMLDDRNYEVFLHENRFRFPGDIMYSSCHPTWLSCKPFVQNFHCLCLCFLCCCTLKLKTKHTTTTTTTTTGLWLSKFQAEFDSVIKQRIKFALPWGLL